MNSARKNNLPKLTAADVYQMELDGCRGFCYISETGKRMSCHRAFGGPAIMDMKDWAVANTCRDLMDYAPVPTWN